jgi:hypothetical protein
VARRLAAGLGREQDMEAGRLSGSDSDGCVLRIAASIANGVAVDLGECLSTLDEVDTDLVVDAVRRAAPGGVGAGRGERR